MLYGEILILRDGASRAVLSPSQIVEFNDGSQWKRGIYVDSQRIVRAIRIGTQSDHQDVPSDSLIYIRNRLDPTQVRGRSFLKTCVSDIRSLDRVTSAEFKAMLVSSAIAFVRKSGLAADIDGDLDELSIAAGASLEIGRDEDIDILESSRPSTEKMKFLTFAIRRVASALGVAPELLLAEFSQSYSASRQSRTEHSASFDAHRRTLASFYEDRNIVFKDREAIDPAKIGRYYTALIEMGVITPSQVATRLGFNE